MKYLENKMLENLKKNFFIGFKDYDCYILRYWFDEIIFRVCEVRCRMNYNKKNFIVDLFF